MMSSKHVLDPLDRISEILFGLIMVMACTGSLSVAEVGRDPIRAMLVGAVGCNLAWGIIDSVFYLMECLAEKGRRLSALRAVRSAVDPHEGGRLVAQALSPEIASVLQPAELEAVHQRLKQLPEPPAHARLEKDEWLGGLAVLLLVLLSTFPVVIPFIVMESARPALRVSHAVAIAMLFVAGYAYGRNVGRRPWVVGISMAALGSLLAALTMALGG